MSRLRSASALSSAFAGQRHDASFARPEPGEREDRLVAAYAIAAERHNALRITAPLDTATTQLYDRPCRALNAGRFAEALAQQIADDEVRDIMAAAGRIGAIDQLSDTTDLLTRPEALGRLRALYGTGEAAPTLAER